MREAIERLTPIEIHLLPFNQVREDILYGPPAASYPGLGHLMSREQSERFIQRSSFTLDFVKQLFLAQSLSHRF